MQQVEMTVENEGVVVLGYNFPNILAATEMFVYLKDFFPNGTFIIQPLRH